MPLPPEFDPGGFDCGEADLTDFLRDGTAITEARACFSTTFLVRDGLELVGYFSVLADSIRLRTKERPEGVSYSTAPALKLGRMGVDKAFRGQKVGHWILAYVVGLARTLSKEMGIRYVTLDALSRPSLVNWYAGYGFIENQGETDRRTAVLKFFKQWKSGQQMDTISMRYDILLQDEVVGD